MKNNHGTFQAGPDGLTWREGTPLPFPAPAPRTVTYAELLEPLTAEERRILGILMSYAATLASSECHDLDTRIDTATLAYAAKGESL